MSKIKKSDLLQLLQEQADMVVELVGMVEKNKQSIIQLENEREKPQLKQLDQSVFDGLDSDYMFAAIDGCTGRAYAYEQKPHIPVGRDYWCIGDGMQSPIAYDYDTSNWQNSLIERDITKELTGSDLARAMLERGDKYVMCLVNNYGLFNMRQDEPSVVIHHCENGFYVRDSYYEYAMPVNNQGEPLTAAEVGL